MREGLFYQDSTKIKDLTVGELKDIILECMFRSQNMRTPLNCIGTPLPIVGKFSNSIELNKEA